MIVPGEVSEMVLLRVQHPCYSTSHRNLVGLRSFNSYFTCFYAGLTRHRIPSAVSAACHT